MIEKIDGLDNFHYQEAQDIIYADYNDFPYCPLWITAENSYDEKPETAKLTDEYLTKLIRKYNVPAIQYKGKIYINEMDMSDLYKAVLKETGIKPAAGLLC